MQSLKRTICGVTLYVATDDPVKIAEVKTRLDAMHQSHETRRLGGRTESILDRFNDLLGGTRR